MRLKSWHFLGHHPAHEAFYVLMFLECRLRANNFGLLVNQFGRGKTKPTATEYIVFDHVPLYIASVEDYIFRATAYVGFVFATLISSCILLGGLWRLVVPR